MKGLVNLALADPLADLAVANLAEADLAEADLAVADLAGGCCDHDGVASFLDLAGGVASFLDLAGALQTYKEKW